MSPPGPAAEGNARVPLRVLVTGGAGFIGSALCRALTADPANHVVNVDSLTYAGNPDSLRRVEGLPNYRFYKTDIRDEAALLDIMRREAITGVMHLAAESHVDRSIDGPAAFIDTNVMGTCRLLGATLSYWKALAPEAKRHFRFLHVSTDEVFGALSREAPAFTEHSPYAPSSPYAASKAAADHLARAWHTTFGLPVLVTNCSNNYGPCHFPEKLIPLVILNALDQQPLPVYGDGGNIRDWLYVEDHVAALETVLRHGRIGQTYVIGGRAERSNLDVVQTICALLDARRPRADGRPYSDLVTFVRDRPGHDLRYAIDPARIETELGWRPRQTFESGLSRTVDWYLDNAWWWQPLRTGRYRGERLGLAAG